MERIVHWLSYVARVVMAPFLVLWFIAETVQYAVTVLIGRYAEIITTAQNAPWKANVQTVGGAGAYLAAANTVFPVDDLIAYVTAYAGLAGLIVVIRWVKSLIPALSN